MYPSHPSPYSASEFFPEAAHKIDFPTLSQTHKTKMTIQTNFELVLVCREQLESLPLHVEYTEQQQQDRFDFENTDFLLDDDSTVSSYSDDDDDSISFVDDERNEQESIHTFRIQELSSESLRHTARPRRRGPSMTRLNELRAELNRDSQEVESQQRSIQLDFCDEDSVNLTRSRVPGRSSILEALDDEDSIRLFKARTPSLYRGKKSHSSETS